MMMTMIICKVVHHPPTLALHSEGKRWRMWQEFSMSTKIRGNSLHLVPNGQSSARCEMPYSPKSGSKYI